MSKSLFIAEKPSVAKEFAKALKITSPASNGHIENDKYIVTWCVGHLVTMSYPEKYDIKYKKWSLDTLPFMPDRFLYEPIVSARKQYDIVSSLLLRSDVSRIYVCTDAGREGEYIYRLVDEMVGVKCEDKRRVWIDSQTEEEILRGIKEAKPLSEYDNLCNAAYLRAKEDYLMGINFSRVLSLKYGSSIANFFKQNYTSISVGRVMTCALGMIVNREREIRDFVKKPFFKILTKFAADNSELELEWKVNEKSKYFNSPLLYKENGFSNRNDAEDFVKILTNVQTAIVSGITRKKEKKQAPLLFNLAELQNTCSKALKISPDETLKITQELYEKKLVTYPRTDSRVLSTAVSKVIATNIKGLGNVPMYKDYVDNIVNNNLFANLSKTKYVNDKQVTDHYAIIPTGQGLSNLKTLSEMHRKVYDKICRRFLSIFYGPAIYEKIMIDVNAEIEEGSYTENFRGTSKVLVDKGFMEVSGMPKTKDKDSDEDEENLNIDLNKLSINKGDVININSVNIKEGETTPPKRYNSGAMILAMENAGQLIEDEELRSQIKGSGIGTSATRAEILKKLVTKKYINLNNKTQIYTPTQLGEMIYEVVARSIRQLLNPKLTASWEKGLSLVEKGEVDKEEYMEKLQKYVSTMTSYVIQSENSYALRQAYANVAKFYK